MSQDIKIWEIANQDNLKEISRSKLNLEERLENWLDGDISMISNDLLVIGRQVQTDLGGVLDLLCIDYNGDLVIVELKRDKTPREITAQVLDYASWTDDLSNDKITDIADQYLGKKGPLKKAFRDKFNAEIPEILNEHHKMIIVASEIDSSSERIIEYLSNTYGVGINAVTFQYFKDGGKEFLSRVFLIEPSEADYRAKTKSFSKRKPPLTREELEELAEKNGVNGIYNKIVLGADKYFDQTVTTMSSVAFIGIGKDKSRSTIFSILPGESNIEKGLHYKIYIDRFADYFESDRNKTIDFLPSYKKITEYEGMGEYGRGYFKDEEQVDKFLSKLAEIKKK